MYGVTGFFGNPLLPLKIGNGKTLLLVSRMYEAYLEGKKIYTNLNVNFEHTKVNSFFDILSENLGNCFVGIDEIKSFVGTKYTGIPTALKDDILLFIDQQRKRKIPFEYTNQEFNTAPLFIREKTNFFYVCHKIHVPEKIQKGFLNNLTNYSCLKDDTECQENHVFIAEPINVLGTYLGYYIILENQVTIKELFDKYDTYQIIEKMVYKKGVKNNVRKK